MPDTVTLAIDGHEIDTFSEVDISISLLEPGTPWTLSLWYSTSRLSTWQYLFGVALEGARVRIDVSGATQVTGVIEHRRDHGDRASGGTITISGRDLAGPLMDSDADPRIDLHGLTLGDLFDKFVSPYGLSARLLDGAGATELRARPRALSFARRISERTIRRQLVDSWRAKPGQKIWDLLDQACKRAGFLLWTAPYPLDDPPGIGLVVDAPADSGTAAYGFTRVRHADRQYGGNILEASHTINGRGVPTEVTAFASTRLDAQQDTRLRATVVNDRRSDNWSLANPLPRPRYIHADEVHDHASAERVATRAIAVANAHRRVYECAVKGYRSEIERDSPIYTVNALAYVRDDFLEIDETMLITEVNFHSSRENGQITKLKLVPRGVIQVIPQ